MYHSPSIGMPCGPEQVVDDGPFLVGALEAEVDLEAVGVLPEPEGLGHDHAAGSTVVRKTTSWPATARLGAGSSSVSGRTVRPRSSRTTSQSTASSQSSARAASLGIARCGLARSCSSAWGRLAASSGRGERERQRGGPDRVASDQLERPVRVVPGLRTRPRTATSSTASTPAPFCSSWTSSR